MNRILVTAFRDPFNSSEILLDKINAKVDKLYLSLGFEISKKEFMNIMENNEYDYIISFGQKPVTKKIYIEEYAFNLNIKYHTNYDYLNIINVLEQNNLKYKISNNAGHHYCNYIYYLGLKFIKDNKLKTKMVFIHIPYLNRINNINDLANVFSKYFDAIK